MRGFLDILAVAELKKSAPNLEAFLGRFFFRQTSDVV